MSLSPPKDFIGFQLDIPLFYLENNYSDQPHIKSQDVWLRTPLRFISELITEIGHLGNVYIFLNDLGFSCWFTISLCTIFYSTMLSNFPPKKTYLILKFAYPLADATGFS